MVIRDKFISDSGNFVINILCNDEINYPLDGIGQNDCKTSCTGGKDDEAKSSTRSGDERMHTCGLNARGNGGGIGDTA